MDIHFFTYLQHFIGVSTVPIALIPGTALIGLIFYNRLANLHNRIHALQNNLREIYHLKKMPSLDKEATQVIKKELLHVHRRSACIRFTLFCTLLGFIGFFLCGLFIVVGAFFKVFLHLVLFAWMIAAIIVIVGLIFGMIELLFSITTMQMQTVLVEEWHT